jgi:hypothetical protein
MDPPKPWIVHWCLVGGDGRRAFKCRHQFASAARTVNRRIASRSAQPPLDGTG